MSDCVYGTLGEYAPGTGCNLTTAWSVNASYEHYWTPAVHESFVGAYAAVSYDDQANGLLCNLEGEGGATLFLAAPGCNNNWSTWGASSRLQWDVTKSFYLGVEVMYNHLNGASSSTGFVPGAIPIAATAPAGSGTGTLQVGGDLENAWSGTFRMHKDFLP